MLVKPSLDQLLPQTENRYTLAVLVAKRARQLMNGGLPMVDSDTPNMVTLSSEEIADDRVVALPGKIEVEVPLRPEVIEARRLAAAAKEENARLEVIQEGQLLPVRTAEELQAERPLDLEQLTENFDATLALQENEAEELPKAQVSEFYLRGEVSDLPADHSYDEETVQESEEEQ